MIDEVRLQSELQPGETLEWTGRPDPWHVFSVSDIILIPFSLLWGGFAIFWEANVIAEGAPLFFKLWGVPFILVGLYIIFGRFLQSAWVRRHTWYGVTSQRILILSTTAGRRVYSLYFNMMPEIEKALSASGRGTLLFGPPPSYRTYTWIRAGSGRGHAPGFYDILDAQYVFDLISRLRRTSQ